GVAYVATAKVVTVGSSGLATPLDNGSALYLGCAVIKYSPAGTPVWTNRFDQAGVENPPQAVITDSKGAIYVACRLATVKFSAKGTVQWDSPAYVGAPNYDTPPRFVVATPREVVLVQDDQRWSGGVIINYLNVFDFVQRPGLGPPPRIFSSQ